MQQTVMLVKVEWSCSHSRTPLSRLLSVPWEWSLWLDHWIVRHRLHTLYVIRRVIGRGSPWWGGSHCLVAAYVWHHMMSKSSLLSPSSLPPLSHSCPPSSLLPTPALPLPPSPLTPHTAGDSCSGPRSCETDWDCYSQCEGSGCQRQSTSVLRGQ